MEILITRSQFAALLNGGKIMVGPTKKVVTLKDGPFVIKGGPGSGFARHVGRLGEVGGSAPAGTPPPQKPMPRQKYSGEPRGIGRVRVPANREETKLQTEKLSAYFHHLVWTSNALKGMDKDRLRKALYNITDWEGMLDDLDEDDLSDIEKEIGAYTLDIVDHLIDRYHLGDFMTDDQRTAINALRQSLGGADYDPFRHLEPEDISSVQQYLDYAPDDLKNEKWYQSQVAQVMAQGFSEQDGEIVFHPQLAWASGGFDDVQPEVAEMIVENWASRAITQDTPEHRMANRAGGSDPYFFIQNLLMKYDAKRYSPVLAGQDADYARMIENAWQQATTQPGSVLLSEAAVRKFGGEAIPRERASIYPGVEAGEGEVGAIESDLIDLGMSEDDALRAGDRLVSQMYIDTQSWLAERGYKPGDTVRLYRGLENLADKDWNPEGLEGEHRVDMWSISSWSYDVDVAYGFAQTEEGERFKGAIVAADIPIEKLLANSDTGPPSQNEGEWIVLGSDGINAQVYAANRTPYIIEWGMDPATNIGMVSQVMQTNNVYANEIGFVPGSRATRGMRGMLGLWTEETFPFRSALPTLPIDKIADRWIYKNLANIGIDAKSADSLIEIDSEMKPIIQAYRGVRKATMRRRERETNKISARIMADQISSIPLPQLNDVEPEDIAEAVEKADWITRGGPGSGHAGHVGREGEIGGSAPAGTPAPSKYGEYSPRPRHQVYGSQIFTPMLKEIVYSWQGRAGWGVAQQILYDIERARRNADDSVQGMALGSDGELVGIASLDFDAVPKYFITDIWEAQGIDYKDMMKINGMFAAEPGNGEEMMIQVAIEAAAHGKGIWAVCSKNALAFYAQMGFEVGGYENKKFAYLSAEQVSNIAETFTTPEQSQYVAPSAKPRWTVSFDDAFDEYVPENPVSDEPPPAGVDQMDFQDRYRWETMNYEQGENFDPEKWARTQAGYGEKDFISSQYDSMIVEEVKAISEGWVNGGPLQGSDNLASIRFSEGVAEAFGGEAMPEERALGPDHINMFEYLATVHGTETVLAGVYETRNQFYQVPEDEQKSYILEFMAFTEGLRDQDMSLDTGEFAQRIYEDTQARLSEAGFQEGDTVRLYRGLRSTPETRLPEGADGGWVDLDMYSVSSWTFSKSRAANFACMEGGAGSEGGSGTLVSADVPIERILNFWETGPASDGEMEWLVLGQDGISAYLTKVDQRRPIYEAQAELEAGLRETGEEFEYIGEEAE